MQNLEFLRQPLLGELAMSQKKEERREKFPLTPMGSSLRVFLFVWFPGDRIKMIPYFLWDSVHRGQIHLDFCQMWGPTTILGAHFKVDQFLNDIHFTLSSLTDKEIHFTQVYLKFVLRLSGHFVFITISRKSIIRLEYFVPVPGFCDKRSAASCYACQEFCFYNNKFVSVKGKMFLLWQRFFPLTGILPMFLLSFL